MTTGLSLHSPHGVRARRRHCRLTRVPGSGTKVHRHRRSDGEEEKIEWLIGASPCLKATGAGGNWYWSDPEVRGSTTSPDRNLGLGCGEPGLPLRPTRALEGAGRDQRVATG